MKNSNEIWSEATTLFDFVTDKFGHEIEQRIANFHISHPTLKSETDNLSTLEMFCNSMKSIGLMTTEKDARKDAFYKLKNDLIAGNIIVIGLNESNTENGAEIIPANFWFKASINSSLTEATSNSACFSELRVIPQINTPLLPTEQELLPIEQELSHPTITVPSPKDLRPLAIEACFNSGKIDFENMNLKKRVEKYSEWIKENYPACDIAQGGFSFKSFEAGETKFKKKQ